MMKYYKFARLVHSFSERRKFSHQKPKPRIFYLREDEHSRMNDKYIASQNNPGFCCFQTIDIKNYEECKAENYLLREILQEIIRSNPALNMGSFKNFDYRGYGNKDYDFEPFVRSFIND